MATAIAGPVEPNSECSDATASSSMDTDESSTEVASILSKLRSDKNNANTLSILGAFLSII